VRKKTRKMVVNMMIVLLRMQKYGIFSVCSV